MTKHVFFFSMIFLLSIFLTNTALVDGSNEIDKANSYEKLISCLILIEMKFDTGRALIAEKLSQSPHREKDKLYDKYYYSTLKYCLGRIKEEDWKYISKNFINLAGVDKLNINWIIENETNEKILKDKKIKLELDDEELNIKKFIDQDEKIENYLPKIEKKIENGQNKKEPIKKQEIKKEIVTNEMPFDKTYVLLAGFLILFVILALKMCTTRAKPENENNKKKNK